MNLSKMELGNFKIVSIIRKFLNITSAPLYKLGINNCNTRHIKLHDEEYTGVCNNKSIIELQRRSPW